MKTLLLLLLVSSPALAEVRSIFVHGEGTVKLKPDRASVQLQVRAKGKEAQAAQAKNAKEMSRVEKLLREGFRIEAKDIQTSGFQVNPEYRYEQNGKQVFVGFQVEHGLTVTVKKLESLGSLLDGFVGKGSEEVSVQLQGVSFDAEKRDEAEIQALESAMKNASARAEALARFAKRPVKGVLRIADSSVQVQPPPFARPMMKTAMSMESAPATQISPGEITVSSQVSVEYEIN